jgi:enterochelin esterase-like enzyme
MRAVTVSLALTGCLLWAGVDAHAQARTVRIPGPYGSTHIFAILLPLSYDASEARYPVVYLFHGGGQDHTAYMARTAFAPIARAHEFIVVMPAADRSYSASRADAQGRYHDFVARELVDYVDSHYRTIPDRERRAIAGLSMGGRIATMTGLSHGNRFGVVGAWSAAFRSDAETAVQNATPAPFFYVSCGTADSLLPGSREFVGWLKARNVSHDYRETPGLGHEWAFWDEQVRVFFDLLESRGFRPSTP